MASRALDELKVVEYAQMVSGPMCGKMFADMGAEVIKIEPPRIGDEARVFDLQSAGILREARGE